MKIFKTKLIKLQQVIKKKQLNMYFCSTSHIYKLAGRSLPTPGIELIQKLFLLSFLIFLL